MPETIGEYTILSEIGSGGFGTVYRARDTLSGQDVALKTLTKITNSNDLERFRREARLAYEIGHPNIIHILHYGEDGGSSFIVMELMPTSLLKRLETGRLSLSKSVDICRQAALGLRAAHDHNVIHRDVKSDNILLDSEGVVKITDFGLARAEDLTTLTVPGRTAPFSPAYASPEQKYGRRVDTRTDIYSLGVVLFEMLLGWIPLTISQQETYFANPSETLGAHRREVPVALRRIVGKCLSDYAEERYQTMDDLLQEIANPALINRCALIDFFEATGGAENWDHDNNWLTDAPLDDWYGVSANRDGTVTELDLSGIGLQDEIPSEIAYLTELNGLHLGGGCLLGVIPPEIGNLTKLQHLNLEANHLTGNIPPEIGNLTNLKRLELGGGNRLSGNIPPEIGNLTKLEVLELYYNRLTGSIPPEIGNLTKLEVLDLCNNHLSGNIPPELGGLPKLRVLGLIEGNNWTGCIPRSVFNILGTERDKVRIPICED